MVVGLYAALATTAGVFVGLLTAYLVSRIVGLKAERRRIERRVSSIDAQIAALKKHHEWRHEQLTEMDRREAERDANDVVDRFIRRCVGDDWDPDPDDIGLKDAMKALVDYQYVNSDDISKFHANAISEQWEDLLEELRPDPPGYFGIGDFDVAPDAQVTTFWDIHWDSIYERRTADFAEIDTEIDGLERERERLVSHYEESNPTELMGVLRSTGWIIVFSVFIPLLVYLLNVIGFVYPVSDGDSVEAVLVFLSWCLGLGLTYRYIERGVLTSESSLPKSPSHDRKVIALKQRLRMIRITTNQLPLMRLRLRKLTELNIP